MSKVQKYSLQIHFGLVILDSFPLVKCGWSTVSLVEIITDSEKTWTSFDQMCEIKLASGASSLSALKVI